MTPHLSRTLSAKISSESFELLLKFGKSSFLRIPDQGPGQAQESSLFKTFWIPAGVYTVPDTGRE
jgi:hypothetical protein